MADTKISALSAATSLDGTEVGVIVQGGSDKKCTTTLLRGWVDSGQNIFMGGGGTSVVISVPTPFNGVSGYDNISIGGLSEDANGTTTAALAALTTGFSNVAIGNSVLMTLTTGNYNVGIGEFVLAAATTSSNNIGIGAYAMCAVTTSASNIAIGPNALQTLTTGSGSNVAIGNLAMSSLTTGSANVSIGGGLQAATTASNNATIGDSSLGNLTTGSANVGLGISSGTGLTTGSNCTFIGSSNLTSTAAAVYAIAIGSGAVVANSNQCVLGGPGSGSASVVLGFGGHTAPADGDVVAQMGYLYWDFTNGAPGMLIKGKTANATVFSGSVLFGVGVSAPSTTATPVFSSYYGGNTKALGDPVAWVQVNIGGTLYKIPLYT